jgi:hypothetical protein
MAELGMAFLNPFAEQQRMDVVDAKLGPEVENLRASARLHNAQAGRMEGEVDAQRAAQAFGQRFLSQMGQDPNFTGPPQEGFDAKNFFAETAQFEIGRGNLEKAGGLLAQSARVEEQAALRDRFKAMEEQARLSNTLKETGWVQQQAGALVREADTLDPTALQAKFDDINDAYEQMFNKPSPYKGKPVSRELLMGLERASMTAAQRAQVDARERTRLDALAKEKRQAAEGQVKEELARARLGAQKEREVKVKKEAGPKAPSVSKTAVEGSVLGLINADEVGKELKGTQKLSALRDLADRTTELLRGNPGLNTEQAARRAMAEAKAAGDFDKSGTIIKTPTYVGGGKSGADPLPLPADKSLRAGRWYNTARGPAKWDGKQFTTE